MILRSYIEGNGSEILKDYGQCRAIGHVKFRKYLRIQELT